MLDLKALCCFFAVAWHGSLTKAGLGIALVSGLCLSDADRMQLEVIEVPRELDADTHYGVVLQRDKHISPLHKSLVDTLVSK